MIVERRFVLTGLVASLGMPSLVRASSIMRVKALTMVKYDFDNMIIIPNFDNLSITESAWFDVRPDPLTFEATLVHRSTGTIVKLVPVI